MRPDRLSVVFPLKADAQSTLRLSTATTANSNPNPKSVGQECPTHTSIPDPTLILSSMSGAPHKTFYLETFGCQMNVHDSEKVIGTLVHEGYRQVETVEQADLILYNTCSIRDKAEQKVFNRLATTRSI